VIEYIYRGFKLSYKITVTDDEKNVYQADGYLTYLLNKPFLFSSRRFHTEYDTHTGAEHEIKQLLEHYVDFELKNFYAMQKERAI
jgi:hypothetical protein